MPPNGELDATGTNEPETACSEIVQMPTKDSSKVLLILMEAVEVVSIPGKQKMDLVNKSEKQQPLLRSKLTFWHRKWCSLCRRSRSRPSCTAPGKSQMKR